MAQWTPWEPLTGTFSSHLCCDMRSPVRQDIDKGKFAAVAKRVVVLEQRATEGAVAVKRLRAQHEPPLCQLHP